MYKEIKVNFNNNSSFRVDFKNSKIPVAIIFRSGSEINFISRLNIINNSNNVDYIIHFKHIIFNIDLDILYSFGPSNAVEFTDCIFRDVDIEHSFGQKIVSIKFNYCFIKKLNVTRVDLNEISFNDSFAERVWFEHFLNQSKITTISFYYNYLDVDNDNNNFRKKLENHFNDKRFISEIEISPNMEISNFLFGNYQKYNFQNYIQDKYDIAIEFELNISRSHLKGINENIYILNKNNIKSLRLSGIFNSLFVNNISVNTIIFDYFKNSNATFSYINLYGNNSFIRFNNSEFSNCKFWKFDLDKFEMLQALSSNLEEAKFSLVPVPDRIISNIKLDQNLKQIYLYNEEHEYYRQLYQIYSSSNDIDNALIAKSKQLNSYYHANKKTFSCEKYLIFLLSKYSNEFGRNWKLALWLWIIVLPLVCYLLLLLSIGRLFCINCNVDYNLIGQFFQFILPTHSTDFLGSGINLNGCSYFFDFLGRIISGFGIYQFITAFRRYGKS